MIHRALFGTYQPRPADHFEFQRSQISLSWINTPQDSKKCPKKVGLSITSLKILRFFELGGVISNQDPPWRWGTKHQVVSWCANLILLNFMVAGDIVITFQGGDKPKTWLSWKPTGHTDLIIIDGIFIDTHHLITSQLPTLFQTQSEYATSI